MQSNGKTPIETRVWCNIWAFNVHTSSNIIIQYRLFKNLPPHFGYEQVEEKKKIHRKNRECHSGNIIPSSFTLQTKAGVNDCSNWVYMDGKWAESQCSLCMCAHDNSRLFASFLFVYRACARRTRAYNRAYSLAHTRVCVCVCIYVGIPSCVCSCERAFTEFVKSIYTRIIYLNTERRFTSLQKFRITSNEFTMMMPRMMLSRLYAHIQRNTHFMD